MSRVSMYVDGFNLYFGLRSAGWRKYYWLDLPALGKTFLRDSQQLVAVHYFTSRIRDNGKNAQDRQRQNDYLDALALRGVMTQEGHYLEKERTCRKCGSTWRDYEEKMTDVNIAMQLLSDAHDDVFDIAFLVSGDSDLTTPVRRVRQALPSKKVIVLFPPKRHSKQLEATATASFRINETSLGKSQLPLKINKPNGHVITRPLYWQ